MVIKIKTKSAEETMDVASKIALSIKPPCVITLQGDLGAGKTTFTKGFAKALGIKENVTSPTFTILNEYKSNTNLYHFDMYRIKDEQEAQEMGFEEYFDLRTLKGYCLVEWAENIKKMLPQRRIDIQFKTINENEREIDMEYKGII